MNNYFKKSLLIPVLILFISCNAPGDNKNIIVSMKTTLGDIKIRLYDETPIHRDNFIKLVNMSYYDGISFHRIIKEFMIQAGDPMTNPVPSAAIPDSLKSSTISAEINPLFFHKKGALAAARQGNNVNPLMRSSATQFYIVQGKQYTDEELGQIEQHINNNIKQSVFTKFLSLTADSVRKSGSTITDSQLQEVATLKMFQFLTTATEYKISEDQRSIYKTTGGTPALDATYTVFGEVIEGLDVVDKIAAVQTDSNDKPVDEIKIIRVKIVRK